VDERHPLFTGIVEESENMEGGGRGHFFGTAVP